MEEKFTTLHLDEVIHTTEDSSLLRRLAANDTFKVNVLLRRIERDVNTLLLEGVECEVMKLDKPGWQKGKVRVKKIELEFCPDSIEESMDESSPLDELRNSGV